MNIFSNEQQHQSRLAGLRREGGFVSIIVCMIIMTILSLITIGFAQIMAREQRQALDRQLSSQAFYAAESGVNDALMLTLVAIMHLLAAPLTQSLRMIVSEIPALRPATSYQTFPFSKLRPT
jgi:hypothetical protein